jgi:hypothetical protein
VSVPSGDGREHVKINAFQIAQSGQRAIYGDLQLYVPDPGTARMLCRVGWLGKGYLLEEMIPIGLYNNKSRPLVSVWNFPKPYRIFPGEGLRVFLTPASATNKFQAVMFNGVKVSDQTAKLLYNSNGILTNNTTQVVLEGDGLNCPADSPVDIYSVTVSEWTLATLTGTNAMQVQIFGPDSRDWFIPSSQIPNPANNHLRHRWIQPAVSLFGLGEERGWVQNRGETLIIEFENADAETDRTVIATLRGSLEVPYA